MENPNEIAPLNAKQRDAAHDLQIVVALRDTPGMTVPELRERLGVTTGAVRAAIKRLTAAGCLQTFRSSRGLPGAPPICYRLTPPPPPGESSRRVYAVKRDRPSLKTSLPHRLWHNEQKRVTRETILACLLQNEPHRVTARDVVEATGRSYASIKAHLEAMADAGIVERYKRNPRPQGHTWYRIASGVTVKLSGPAIAKAKDGA